MEIKLTKVFEVEKTEEVVGKDVVIQEKDKLYVELRNLLARQPGSESRETTIRHVLS